MDENRTGWIYGLIGVVIFSGSLPATRVAVADFDPVFLTVARAALAGLLAAAVLLAMRQKRPQQGDLASLAIVALGVVVGFPLLTALALEHITSARSIVFIGLLPLTTALFGVVRAGERPQLAFWFFSLLGGALVAGFALAQGSAASLRGDSLMVAAILVCGLGYAEGGRLARALGGWQVISWALILSLPPMLLLVAILWPGNLDSVRPAGWLSLVYVSVFSMFVGFIFWYRGLAQGGVAAVSQLQLLQPFFGLVLAGLLLGETVSVAMIALCAAVVACVSRARRFAHVSAHNKADVPQRRRQPRS